jgi:GDSL-like Lipase/Acylhydrolase family
MSFRDVDRGHLAERYRRVPQMEAYDRNEPHLRPYLSFSAQPGHRSPVFNTDAEGFRISASPAGPIDCARWLDLGGGGLVLGGSYTFGVGATSDERTLPSALAELTGSPQLNLGICAGNSLQEVISALPFLHAAGTVVVCSGVNNVFAALQSLGLNERFGPLFWEGALHRLGQSALPDVVDALGGRRAGAAAAAGGASPLVPTAEGEADLEGRLDAALERQARDLRTLAGARPPGARLVFCLQPFADPELRDPVPEERDLFDLAAGRQGAWLAIRDLVVGRWERCRERMEAACAEVGASFVDLAARRFAGWAFIDRVHMTDAGYRQAAELVREALC